MNGVDPGAIAMNAITYFGGAAGGEIVLAAIIVFGLLAALHWVQPHYWTNSIKFGAGAWVAAFILRQILGWVV
jgi:hypothetical protein